MNEKTVTVKTLVVGLMTAWCSDGGIATDLNDQYTYSPDEENDFIFEKDGYLRIHIQSNFAFAFLSELETIIGQPDYISFNDDDCYIHKNEIRICVYCFQGR